GRGGRLRAGGTHRGSVRSVPRLSPAVDRPLGSRRRRRLAGGAVAYARPANRRASSCPGAGGGAPRTGSGLVGGIVAATGRRLRHPDPAPGVSARVPPARGARGRASLPARSLPRVLGRREAAAPREPRRRRSLRAERTGGVAPGVARQARP